MNKLEQILEHIKLHTKWDKDIKTKKQIQIFAKGYITALYDVELISFEEYKEFNNMLEEELQDE